MRLFIAIRLSDALKNELIKAQESLYSQGIRGNYTPEENLHLTLAFIGEYPDPHAVLDALANVAIKPFDIRLQGIGSFRDLWWAGLEESAPLTAVAGRVRRALAENGIPFDKKKFKPHITLLRRGIGEVSAFQIESPYMTVKSISLMRSDRGKHGMIYTEVGTV